MVAKGHFILRSYAKPPVTAGHYQLHATQPDSGVAVEAYDGEVYVKTPRYVMPPEQVLSTYPPAMAEGDFGGRLPHIVLKRRTMPWERRPDPSRPLAEDPPVPWLALIVTAEGEGSVTPEPKPVADCVTPGTALPDPTDVDSATGYYLTVTDTVVKKIFPTIEDLPLLVHVREVDISDTELGAGDDDGFLAVVLANRLPIAIPQPNDSGGTDTRPVKYLACLVNLEGQLAALPTAQTTDDFLEYEAAVQDLRAVAYAGATHADHYTMGTGTAFTPNKSAPVSLSPASTPSPVAEPARVIAAANWAVGTTDAVRPTRQLIAERGTDSIRIEMAGGFAIDFERFVLEPTYRFPVLAHWSFTSTNEGDFRSLMQALDVGLIGTQYGTVLDGNGEHPNEPDPTDPPRPPVPEVAATGHIALPQTTRRGDPATAWFRGPLSAHPTERLPAATPPAHMSDELRATTPDGREDVSRAAAFEIGRLLALSQPSLVSALVRWRREQFGAARATQIRQLLTKQTVFDIATALRDKAGRALGLDLLVRGGEAPGKLFGPSRPLADPGMPLDIGGSLDQVVATGLGLDLAALRKLAAGGGMAHALATTPPVVAPANGLEGASAGGLRTALDTELARVEATAARSTVIPKRRRKAVEAPDALDALIDGAGRRSFEVAADQEDRP